MTVSYSSDDFEDLMTRLRTLRPLESSFRAYYQITHGQLQLPPEEEKRIRNEYEHFSSKFQDVLPDTSEPFFQYGPIAILQHLRYMPTHVHRHAFFEFFYILEGSCSHISGNRKYSLKKGDFCLWQHDIPHQIVANSDECIGINILVQKSAFQLFFFGNMTEYNLLNQYFENILYGKGDSPLLLFHTGDDPMMFQLICSIFLEYERKEPYWQGSIVSMLNYVFVHLLRRHQEHVTTSQHTEKSDPILAILMYIQEHFATVTLESLGKEFGYTTAYLSRCMKAKTGSTFSQIVTQQKMLHAAVLLSTTQRSISQISDDIGCTDSSHFSRQFLKTYGISPSAYRKEHENHQSL